MPEGATSGRRYAGQDPEQRRAERGERLLAAALDLFGTQGYAGTGIDALCARAGVSPRHFYEHAASREELFVAVYDRCVDRVLGEVAAVAADPGSSIEELTRATIAATLRGYADPRAARIVLVEVHGVSRTVEAHRQEALARFVEQNARLLREHGGLDALEARVVAITLVGGVSELCLHHVADPEGLPADAIADVVARLVSSVAR